MGPEHASPRPNARRSARLESQRSGTDGPQLRSKHDHGRLAEFERDLIRERVKSAWHRLERAASSLAGKSRAQSILSGPRAPTPLLFAVAAVIHAAPLPAVAFARVEKIDTAVGSSALPNSSALNARQQIFNGKRTCVQWGVGSCWTRPTVVDKVSRRGHHENAGSACCSNCESNCVQIPLRYELLFADTSKYVVDMFSQLTSTLGDA